MAPAIRLGADLAESGLALLGSLQRVDDLHFVRIVPEPNNRVELRYRNRTERHEILSGGVSGWSPDDIDTLLSSLDAIYVNFISGNEMTLPGATRIRDRMEGPSWADLHSLFLGVAEGGARTPRLFPRVRRWAQCFDTVQMNEPEFALFVRGIAGAGASRNPDLEIAQTRAAVAEALGGRLSRIAVTRGEQGVTLFARNAASGSALQRTRVPVPGGGQREGDPTGCGDIWGASCFAGLLGGLETVAAARRANRVASLNPACTGAMEIHATLARSGDAWSR